MDDDGERGDRYLELLRNKVGIGFAERFLAFIARSRKGAGEAEGSIVWLARVDACVATAVRCLTEREVGGTSEGKVLC